MARQITPNASKTARRHGRTATLRRRGFTLIELLVVVSIVILLISILLPVLGNAREAARQVACAAHQRGAAQALAVYATDENGWFAGPHTSGFGWNHSPNLGGNSYGLDSIDPGETSPRTQPLQNMDWISPTLGQSFGLPNNDLRRAMEIYDIELRCPSNDQFYNDTFSGQWPLHTYRQIHFSSYTAAITFHGFPNAQDPQYPDEHPPVSSYFSGVTIPSDYAPRMDQIGSPAAKAYLQEGARYVSNGSDAYFISLNLARYQKQGGGFMALSPYTAGPDTPFVLPGGLSGWDGSSLSQFNRDLAFRHSGGMNLAFFDGHVEHQNVKQAVIPDKFLPRGSIIDNASQTYSKDDANGDVIR